MLNSTYKVRDLQEFKPFLLSKKRIMGRLLNSMQLMAEDDIRTGVSGLSVDVPSQLTPLFPVFCFRSS